MLTKAQLIDDVDFLLARAAFAGRGEGRER